jgi:tetratricopeptide (TPR) repeat protein
MWALLALVCAFPGFWNDPSADGLKALDEKRYADAVQNFTAAIAADPKNYSTHFNLAFALSMLHRDADSAAEYRKTLDIKPDLYEAQLNLGVLLVRDKQPADAVPLLQRAAAQKPGTFRPIYYLGEAQLDSGDAPGAQQSFQTALGLDPKSAFAELGLARALTKQNRLDDAAPHFRKAAELDPTRRDILLELAAEDEAAGKSDDAIAIYNQFPDNPAAQERLGQLLLKAGRAPEAVDHFKVAVARAPTSANRVGLVQAYLKTHQPDLALPLIDQELAASPNEYDLVWLKGGILRDQRKFDQAAAAFTVAARLRPDDWMPWSELAGVLVVAGDFPAALQALDRIRALNAEKPGHVFLRAIAYDHMQEMDRGGKTHHKELQAALESYQRFLELSGGADNNDEFKARQRIRIIQRELNGR